MAQTVTKYNCFPGLTKKIKIPKRKELMAVMNGITNDLKNKFVPVEEMVDLLAFYVSNRYKVNVSHATSMKSPSNSMIISGEYDSESDEEGRVPINLIFITHTTDKILVWDEETFEFVSKQIADTLIHELVHMKQTRDRNFEPVIIIEDLPNDEEEINRLYLKQSDEIDAYAYNIASELDEEENQEIIKKYLSCPSLTPMDISINLWNYMQVFEKNLQDKTLKRLMKKVYKRYHNLKK